MATPDVLTLHAAATPDRPALIDGATGEVTTFGELETLAGQACAAFLRAGARPGDRMVWCGPNSRSVVVTIHAARKAGLVAVPLSYRFVASEMQYVVDNSDATLVVVDAEQAPLVASVRDQLPKVRAVIVFDGPVPAGCLDWDTALAPNAPAPGSPAPGGTGTDFTEMDDPARAGATMIYTSGTTGKPKGALRTRTDPALVGALIGVLGLGQPDDVHLTTGPMYHSGPLAFASLATTMGAPVVILRKFDASRWLQLVGRYRVTNTFSAPTQLKRIVSLPDDELAAADLSSMRCLIANAAPVPYALKQEIIAKLGDGFLYEVYGSTELGVDTVLEPADQLRKPGSCGRPYGGIEFRIVDDAGDEVKTGERGELFVRTPLAMDGYHRTNEQLASLPDADWHSVGDVAYLDDEGYLYICDRKKDMIISGGMNIYPAEIEAVLYEHPDILDVAVFGVPDDEWGERVHAVVQAKGGAALDLDAVRAFADERVAGYKRPRSYEQRAELPRTESGKLLKRVLRDEFWTGRDMVV